MQINRVPVPGPTLVLILIRWPSAAVEYEIEEPNVTKQIAFSECTPAYCGAQPGLECAAVVDGTPARYQITAEALEDHFGARSCRWDDLLAAFDANREQIQAVAREVFEMTDAHSIVLHSGMFRFEP